MKKNETISMGREWCRAYAITRARSAGLDDDTADAVRDRAMGQWYPSATAEEWRNVVDDVIQCHAMP